MSFLETLHQEGPHPSLAEKALFFLSNYDSEENFTDYMLCRKSADEFTCEISQIWKSGSYPLICSFCKSGDIC